MSRLASSAAPFHSMCSWLDLMAGARRSTLPHLVGHASDLGLFENAIKTQNVIYIIYISIYWFVCFCLFIYWFCLSTGKMVTNRNLGKPIFPQAKCTWWLLEADWHWSRKRWGHRFDWHQWDFNWSWKLRMQDIPPACWKLPYDVAKSTTGGLKHVKARSNDIYILTIYNHISYIYIYIHNYI